MPPPVSTGYGHSLGDGPHQVEVPRRSFPGSVEVDHVQDSARLRDPVLGHGHRVVAEHGLVGEVAPAQAHAAAALDVDGRNEPHQPAACISRPPALPGGRSSGRSGAPEVLDFSGWNCTAATLSTSMPETKVTPS